jgi:hypothetical protein
VRRSADSVDGVEGLAEAAGQWVDTAVAFGDYTT